MQRLLLITAATSALLLSGCVLHIGDDDDGYMTSHRSVASQERQARRAIAEFPLGTSPQAVMAELGPPDFSDLLRSGAGTIRVLRYRTHRTHADGDTTRDETTPLIFMDGELIGSGDAALHYALGE
ncbi:DUF3192 domain-containing protein [bacterium]|nr:DUF3192 domain-containing protein [bacterium]